MDKQEIFDGLLDSFEAINDEMAQHQDNEFRQSENFKPFFARLLAMGELLREMDEVLIKKAQPVTALSGMLKRDGQASVSLDDMEHAIRKGALSDGMKSDR